MQTDAYRLGTARIVTFAIAGLAAASAVYWGLQISSVSTRPTPLAAHVEQQAPVSTQALARALGGGLGPAAAVPSAAPAASRYNLVGVLAGHIPAGAALISVDGQEAKPVRVGTLVDNDMVLESVTGRQAVLSPSTGKGAKLVLEMPLLAQ